MLLRLGGKLCAQSEAGFRAFYANTVLMAILPDESGLAGCPHNTPSPFIPGLRILLGQV